MKNLTWRVSRLKKMSVGEVGWRARDEFIKQSWRSKRWRPQPPAHTFSLSPARLALLPYDALPLTIAPESYVALGNTAQRIMAGHIEVLGETTERLGGQPDWFTDIRSGKRAPDRTYSFDIPYHDPGVVGEVKYVWEPSRHHHLTVLAAAYYISHEEGLLGRISEHLRSWWTENPFLCGIHWTSGIEIGIRLLSWTWIRRLLSSWPKVADLFENNGEFVHQLYWHQAYLAAFPSRQSSANNHRVAEAAGLFTAATAFPIFEQSVRWRAAAAKALELESHRQTYPDGLNRELATGYHGLTLELLLVAAGEDNPADPALSPTVWRTIAAMTDALASMVDQRGSPPRQGDEDGASALIVDGDGFDRWRSLLLTGDAVFGRRQWWPDLPSHGDVRAALLAARAGRHAVRDRPSKRTYCFQQGGMVILRDLEAREDELWCRCDHGPLGFLATAAHGHADALSIELRVGGIDLLCDPGTYCYHGQDDWRAYFRSTRAHNTIEVAGIDQCRSGGPFLWLDQPRSTLKRVSGLDSGDIAEWSAVHYGYERLPSAVAHHRQVRLDRGCRTVEIVDFVTGSGEQQTRLYFHLGPHITCQLKGQSACLSWFDQGGENSAVLELPVELHWTLHRGEVAPILGWYSPTFGTRVPSSTLVGCGCLGNQEVRTRLVIGSAACPRATAALLDRVSSQ